MKTIFKVSMLSGAVHYVIVETKAVELVQRRLSRMPGVNFATVVAERQELVEYTENEVLTEPALFGWGRESGL